MKHYKGIGCDGSQVFDLLLEISHPLPLNQLLFLSLLLTPSNSLPVLHTAPPDFLFVTPSFTQISWPHSSCALFSFCILFFLQIRET